MECDGCRNKLTKVAYICTEKKCKKSYCALCANVGQGNIDLSTWKCPACRSKERKTGYNSSSTPVRSNLQSENVIVRKKSTPVTSSTTATLKPSPPLPVPNMTSKPPSPHKLLATGLPVPEAVSGVISPSASELSELTSVIRSLTLEITTLKDRLEIATSSLTKCHQRLDELGETAAHAETRLKKLEESEIENKALKATVGQLQLELKSQAQIQVRNEVEIVGIPELANENLIHIVLTAAVKIGVDLKEEDIDWVSRAGPKPARKIPDSRSNLSRAIVFRCVRRTKRDNFIKAARLRKNINTQDLLQGGPDHRIYINERLTREIRLLFREARTKAKEHGFQYCWTNQGNIFVRQREGKPGIAIKTQEDILRIFPDGRIQAPGV